MCLDNDEIQIENDNDLNLAFGTCYGTHYALEVTVTIDE